MYLLGEPRVVDTLMHRYGADVFGSASYFSKMRPRALNKAIITAREQEAEEMLYLRWITSRLSCSFSDFRARLTSGKSKKTAAEIHSEMESLTENIKWRATSGS